NILDKNDIAFTKIMILQDHREHVPENERAELDNKIRLLKRCINRRLRRA
ncbi:unnamed protein product, partial [Heterosigma akashiwo]